jgi:hypothetical protein
MAETPYSLAPVTAPPVLAGDPLKPHAIDSIERHRTKEPATEPVDFDPALWLSCNKDQSGAYCRE